jgi:Zn-dependent protease
MENAVKQKVDFEKYHSETVLIRSNPSIRTSNIEILHVVIAWLAISYAFSILLLWSNLGRRPFTEELFNGIVNPFVISLSTVGISFLVHEMSHKIVAQRYGSWAEFRMSPFMLFLMLFLVYEYGILFAAPGAVMIYGGHIGKRENGRISLAGPLSNLLLGFAFFPLLSESGILYEIGRYGVIINIVLALFNLIPFGIFDGRKVWAWNKLIYLIVVITALALLFFFVFRLITPISQTQPF